MKDKEIIAKMEELIKHLISLGVDSPLIEDQIKYSQLESDLASLRLQEEKEVSDEDIEKWAISRCKSENESRYIALQEGAKAHRDNLIKKGE